MTCCHSRLRPTRFRGILLTLTTVALGSLLTLIFTTTQLQLGHHYRRHIHLHQYTSQSPTYRYNFTMTRRVTNINCKALFDADTSEITKAKNLNFEQTKHYSGSDQSLSQRASDCEHYIKDTGYITNELTETEANFSIAYSIIMYKNTIQVETLLRAIYRPQNLYCFHIDATASEEVVHAMRSVAKCFPNVFLSARRVDVVWGRISVLESEIACMEEMFNRSKTWRYLINLTGQEFPLKTNAELVAILTAMNGSSVVLGETLMKARGVKGRFRGAGPPPHGLTPTKGITHIVVARPFVEFIVRDSRAADLLKWVRNVHIPDEAFFSTLYLNPSLNITSAYKYKDFPPSFQAELDAHSIIRFKLWWKKLPGRKCPGGYNKRGVCILGVDYLPMMAKSPDLFANKFFWEHERAGLACMDELLYNRTRQQYTSGTTLNTTRYSKLPFVVNKI